jgi:hypothetical protein
METNSITTKFASTYNRGFQMKFSNGITISVQFGPMNYCERRSMEVSNPYYDMVNQNVTESGTAEIAIWDDTDTWFNFGNNDTVMGWVTPDEVAVWIDLASKARTLTELETLAIKNNLVMPA